MMWRPESRMSLSSILPLTSRLPDGRTVIVDFSSESQLKETYVLLHSCGSAGDGIGLDEFPSEEVFRKEIDDGDSFSVVCDETGNLLASFILAVSRYYRGSSAAVDPYVVVGSDERQKGIGSFCMNLVLEFSQRLGYEGIYVDTFCNNEPMKKILEKAEFTKVGYLPLGGKLKNGTVVGSFIYFKSLTVDKKQHIIL